MKGEYIPYGDMEAKFAQMLQKLFFSSMKHALK